jgi:hypothetical protein
MISPRFARGWNLARECCAAAANRLRMPGRSHAGALPPADGPLEALAAELQGRVKHLSETIGERNLSRRPRQLMEAAEYIEAEFAADGYAPRRQEYDVSGVVCWNVEVEIPGTRRPDDCVVIGAHYDSVPNSPAANDNGSGVAAMLGLARRFASAPQDRTLRFLAFVNEELPYAHTPLMGSWVYARRCRERGDCITSMISLETIGYYSDERNSQRYPPPVGLMYPAVGNFIAFVGNTRYGDLVRRAIGAFRRTERFPSQGGAMPESLSHIGRSDHWSFWQEGYPALMVTDTANFRYPYYHTPDDTPEKLDYGRMARVVRGLDGVVRALCTER